MIVTRRCSLGSGQGSAVIAMMWKRWTSFARKVDGLGLAFVLLAQGRPASLEGSDALYAADFRLSSSKRGWSKSASAVRVLNLRSHAKTSVPTLLAG